MLCYERSDQTRVIVFPTDYSVVDRIINHLKLTFVAEEESINLMRGIKKIFDLSD